MLIDFRSDTVTRPTPTMLNAMMSADVGDDVFGEDNSVNTLETMAAKMFGMEAALYCPTGTMSNQIAIKVHTRPGDEVICDRTAHVYQYEGGGIAANAGAQVKLIDGERGKITSDAVVAAINPDDVHKPYSALVCLENTSNRGGGGCYNIQDIINIREVCDEHSLFLHLDGARLFNALVARNESPQAYGKLFHSISVCLNKGLGCPIGSILIGESTFIKKARRVRKVFGGGMRQAGFMAAAGIYALQNHVERLKQDHQHAREIATALAQKGFAGNILPVETNIIICSIKSPHSPKAIVEALRKENILLFAISSTQIRMVLHLDITPEMVRHTIRVIDNLNV